MPTEADTCRKFVVPKLQAAGWDNEPHSIAEQRWFTPGRIVVRGNRAERRRGKRADYLLRYARDFPIAVVEAKAEYKKPGDGLQQAKDYAETLDLKFAFATNGLEIIEFDYITGRERAVPAYPTPAELWSRLRATEKLTDDDLARRLLAPVNLTTDKEPRYYQTIAINRAVQAILQGNLRVLLTMATGTGKTVVAFQICWKLWSSKWNRTVGAGDGRDRTNKTDIGAGAAPLPSPRKPRILYLADRNFLVDDPKDKIFAPFGDARHKIEGGVAVFSRELYFATYQSIAKDERRLGLYKEFAPLLAWWGRAGQANEREENERAWRVPAAELLAAGCNLDRKNPRAKEDITHLPPAQLAADILQKEKRIAEIVPSIQKLLAK
jgi:type I restriction enzyme R subunit